MNTVILIGRLVSDFDVKGNTARSCVAVDRDYTKDVSDFINITAFGKTADFCSKYARKGQTVVVVGSWQTYKNNEGKVFHSCAIKEFKILSEKQKSEGSIADFPAPQEDDDVSITDDDLPF